MLKFTSVVGYTSCGPTYIESFFWPYLGSISMCWIFKPVIVLRNICKCKRHDKVRYECITNGLSDIVHRAHLLSSLCLRPQWVVWHTAWPPSTFAKFSLSLRSEQIGSTRDSVCRSFYVILFAWFTINNALKKRLNNSFRLLVTRWQTCGKVVQIILTNANTKG